LARNSHLVEGRMSRNLIGAIVVCLLLCFAGAAILGWMWISRDRAAVASYRVILPEGARMEALVEKEAELMRSDAVLKPIIAELDLVTRWKLDKEEDALTRLRAKIKVKPGSVEDRVKVVYRDRSQKRALEILRSINRQFAVLRHEAAMRGDLPPVAPLERPADAPER
jgi:hypothetical protein